MAFTTYALFPAVPPWLASDQGDLGPAQRVVGAVWSDLGVAPAAAIWEKGSSFANEVAAIPSLHTAYPVLILLFFWPGGNRLVRGICLAYALAMSATLVYTGEHYVFDVLLGWAYAAGAYLIVDRVSALLAERRRQRRPAAAPTEGEPATS
jgi:membrane-associated phospholipid phosphatase